MSEQISPRGVFNRFYQEIAAANNGAFIPSKAATMISEEFGVPNRHGEILHMLTHPETQPHVYPDSIPAMRSILSFPTNGLIIWTQGELHAGRRGGYQMQKISTSGLNQELGEEWKASAKAHNIPRVIGGIDKHQLLPDVVAKAKDSNFQQLVIVDDKEENLNQAASIISAEDFPLHTFQIVRKPSVTASLPHNQVASLLELPISTISESPTLWLVDLDYTLLDHGKVKEGLIFQLEQLLSLV